MDGFQYETEIIDHMSGPAGKEAAALDHLASEAIKTERAIRELTEKQLNYREAGMSGVAKQAGIELSRLRLHLGDVNKEMSHLEGHGDGFQDFTRSLVPEIALGELAAEGIKKLGEAELETAKAFGELAIEGVHFALEMTEFRENAVAAYTAVKGTAAEGEETFAEIDKLALAIHAPVEKAHDMASQLMEQGLENTNAVEGVIQAVTDLQRTGNDRGANKLQRLIEKSLASGTFEAKGKALAGTGVQLPEVLGQIASDLRQPVDQIKAEMKAGKINAQEGINAIIDVFERSKIHEIAEEKFSLADLATDVKNNFKGMFEDFDIGPVMDAFRDLASLLDQDTASGRLFHTTIHGGIEGLLVLTHDLVEEVAIFGLTLENWALRGTIAIFPLIKALSKVSELIDVAIEAGTLGFVNSDYATRAVHGLKDLAGGLYSYGEGGLTGPPPEGPYKDAKKSGEHIADGLVAGTQDGLGIHSPSTVMAEIGRYAAEGFAGGVEQVTGKTGGKSVTVEEGAIQAHVHVHGTQVTAQEIKEGTTAALDDVLEQLILELGG